MNILKKQNIDRGVNPRAIDNTERINTLVCINLNVFISSSLKFLKGGKGNGINFITNNDMFFFVRYI